ncbi:hypothetical protein [Arthrobacter sp. NicSoilB8]|uniref:hypothetical protein n=1 Tax=Arthrobacter sp. NicSoilB8 TaxID=2830998 RepID=UPI001CC716E0|nr:hypothetical protein [Arthrobacter sp. NicSoilB8]BCW72412.1 hypothetical protein NicSoilB8_34560 [Arthrobacter sp. NicSoilB8]
MSPLTEPPFAAGPAQTTESPTADDLGGNNSAFAAVNPFLDRWLEVVGGDSQLSPEAFMVATVLARSVTLGRVAFTNWQRVNVSLGRQRTDFGVFESIRELQTAGYLGRFQGTRYNKSRGWSLFLPEQEL